MHTNERKFERNSSQELVNKTYRLKGSIVQCGCPGESTLSPEKDCCQKGWLKFQQSEKLSLWESMEELFVTCLLLQPLIVWRSNNAIHRINLYPVDNAIIMFCYHLSAGYRFIRWVALSALYTTGPSAVSLVWEKWLVGFDWMLLALRFWCYKSAVIG